MRSKITILLLLLAIYTQAQVKIGDNPGTINSNSLLELESTNKGFLPPRIALNSASSVSPLTGTVTAGMLVFSTGGTLADGYYYWSGSQWKLVATAQSNVVTKTATATLLKTETIVLASNDITLTLPTVTSSDDGLALTVKNVGSHTDLVTVQGNGGATIDGSTTSTHTRYGSQTYIASAGNWIVKEKHNKAENMLDVGVNSSWTTIQEMVEFLGLHMTGPTVIRLGEEAFNISQTVVVNLPYSLTFQGLSYGTTTIKAVSGLANKPMFRCISDCFFKMLQFDATSLTNYGTLAGEDAIRFIGSGTYNEVKDCTFDSFYNTILDSSNAEIWVFETDISNAKRNGILVHSNVAGVTVKVAETDFIGCKFGINLSKGSSAIIQLASGGYYNALSTDTSVLYQPSTFTFSSMSITGNSWNNTGKFIEGFDFTRTDGRDANAIVESNAGTGDKNPNCYINVQNNSSTTTLTSSALWYKAIWTNTSSLTSKWTIANNRITFQPTNRRDGSIIISGGLSVNGFSRTISIAIVKNGITTTRYGETSLRITTANQPFQFSSVIQLTDIGPGDYFELYCNSLNSGDIVTIQDIQLFVNAK
jgi:hypothetical protein